VLHPPYFKRLFNKRTTRTAQCTTHNGQRTTDDIPHMGLFELHLPGALRASPPVKTKSGTANRRGAGQGLPINSAASFFLPSSRPPPPFFYDQDQPSSLPISSAPQILVPASNCFGRSLCLWPYVVVGALKALWSRSETSGKLLEFGRSKYCVWRSGTPTQCIL
jgi:hypothetical protein